MSRETLSGSSTTRRSGSSAMPSRKRRRLLAFDYGCTVYRWGEDIKVGLYDDGEPDRAQELQLTTDDAMRLAGRLAHQLGYRLVEVAAES